MPARLTVNVVVDDELCIEIIDDGRGIPADVTGSGLTNLRQRAEDAGGNFTVEERAWRRDRVEVVRTAAVTAAAWRPKALTRRAARRYCAAMNTAWTPHQADSVSGVVDKPIVIGVDGSRAALNAVKWAVAEAVYRDVPLRLVHAVPAGHRCGDAVTCRAPTPRWPRPRRR